MNDRTRPNIRCLAIVLAGLALSTAKAETWTDASGKFKVEAEFVGVEGRSIVLNRSGKRLTVPISRLSVESRALAKQLYEKMLAEPTKAAAGGEASAGLAPVRQRALNFTPPTPPAVMAMKTFPDNLTLAQTVAFIKEQLTAGHPEVFWYAVPEEMRQTLDSPKVRDAVSPFVEKQAQMSSQIEQLVFKGIQVLVTKKQFVLGSAMVQDAPPDALPMIQQGYDSAVGLAYELADLGFSFDSLDDRSVQQMVDYHGPKIGGHLHALLPLLPPGTVDQYFDMLEIAMIDDNNGVLVMPKPEEPALENAEGISVTSTVEDLPMTKYSGRWLPKEFVDNWGELKQKLQGDIASDIAAAEKASAQDVQGAMMMIGMMTGMVGTALDSLLAANTQEEFDQVFAQTAGMLNMGGGIGPGGPGIPLNLGAGNDDGSVIIMNEEEDEAPIGPVPEGWTLDLSTVQIPDAPCAGVAGGRDFTINRVRLENGILHLSEGQEFQEKTRFIIFTFLDAGENIEGKKFDISPKTDFGTPHVHFHISNDSSTDMKVYTSGYAMKLEFGQLQGDKLPGRIYLCLKDAHRSLVMGTFKADYTAE